MADKTGSASGWGWGSDRWARTFHHQKFSARGDFKQEGFSAQAIVSRLLDTVSPSGGARSVFGSAELRELHAISNERNPATFFADLIIFGGRLEAAGKPELAAEIYAAIATHLTGPQVSMGDPGPGPIGDTFSALAKKAQFRLQALMGRGPLGGRAEFLLKNFISTATNPSTILPMMAGTVICQISKTAALARLVKGSEASWFARGVGARLSASALGLGMEVPVFTLSSRIMRRWSGTGEEGLGLGEDLLGTTLTLGAFKVFAWAGNVINQVSPLGRGGLGRSLVSNSSTLLGLLASHQIQVGLRLQPEAEGSSLLADLAGTMLSLGIGSHLGHRVFGERWNGLQRELSLREKGVQAARSSHFSWMDFLSKPKLQAAMVEGSRVKGNLLPGKNISNISRRPEISFMTMQGNGSPSQADFGNKDNPLEIKIPFSLTEKPTEAEIFQIVRAVVAQDEELYPGADASPMSTIPKLHVNRWYRIGDRVFNIDALANWVRLARGFSSRDTKVLGDSQILQEWKKAMGVKERERESLKIQLDFELSPQPTEEEILKLIREIVTQDGELYPGGDASLLSTYRKFYSNRWYRIGTRDLTLDTLANWVRKARGLRSHDTKLLSDAQILQEWKKAMGVKARERESLKIQLDFELSSPPTEGEILNLVREIVAQDGGTYPGRDASQMSTSQKYFSKRWYRIGDRELTLDTLAMWVRRARGLKADDNKHLSDSQIVHGWKRAMGVREKERESLKIELDFELSPKPTESEINRIVRAIVGQDEELYPRGDPSALTTIRKFFSNRWYRIGGRDLTLSTLAGWVRRARGLKTDDTMRLSGSQILHGWKQAMGVKEREPESHRIELDFELSRKPSEGEILQLVRAIVTQDKELYPGGDVSRMVMVEKLISRRYEIQGQHLTLRTLTGWLRRARGLKAGDTRQLSTAHILRGWRRALGVKEKTRESRKIDLEFEPSLKPTEAEIFQIVQAIVAQDEELYPGGDASPMSAGFKYFSKRWYRVGDRALTLNTLVYLVRQARGLKSDAKQLSRSEIIQGWKQALGAKEKDRKSLKIQLNFEISPQPNEGEILQILQAIVSQDRELYPDGNISRISLSEKYFRERWYKIGDRDLTLGTLAGWFRRARGLKVQDTKRLPGAEVIRLWKQAFGVEAKENVRDALKRDALNISLNFDLPNKPTEQEILQIVRAIVEQDKVLYPDGDVSRLSEGSKFRKRWYRIGSRHLTLSILAGWFRRARGLKVDSTQLSNLKVMQLWKQALGVEVQEIVRDVLSISLNFDLPDKPTEQEILQIVRAIVEQDKVLYPDGDVSRMSRGAKYFSDRRYRIGDRILKLNTLAGWVRRARGLKSDDSVQLPGTQIIKEWKRSLTGKEMERKGFEIRLGFEPSSNPSESEILQIVRAIVEQDSEFYPDRDPSRISKINKYFFRQYRIGDQNLSLSTLTRAIRRLRALEPDDTNSLSNLQIFSDWKNALGGQEVKKIIKKDRNVFNIHLGFEISPNPAEAEILQIVKAIVEQDAEFYPGGDASSMVASSRSLEDRWYRVGGRDLNLKTLAYWLRRARGLKKTDHKSLPQSQIVQEWKQALGVKKEDRGGLRIELDFEPSSQPSETEVNQIVRAIVEQDAELYPRGDASKMSTHLRVFKDRWYRVGEHELNLNTLVNWVRQERGLGRRELPASQIVGGWKQALGVKAGREGLRIDLGFNLSSKPTEREILEVVRAIVEQDEELYPGGNASNLAISPKYYKNRWYQIGEESVTLQTLVYWVRQARGLKAKDVKALPVSEIFQAWKDALGVFDFSKSSPQDFQQFIQKNDLWPLLKIFPEDPGDLIEALAFLKKNEFKNKDVVEFVKAYVGLHVGNMAGAEMRSKIENHPWEHHRLYLQAMLQALEAAENLDLSETNFRNQLQLLIRLTRKAFEESPQGLVAELTSRAQTAPHPFVKKLQEEAAGHFRRALDYDLREMRTVPYGYQREGAYFLSKHDRAILADEAGMGKSYQVIAAAEHLDFKRVLWVTTAANKETLREEILGHSFVPIERVKIVLSGDPVERREQIRTLNGEKYLITNYETLVALQKTDPEGYAKLTQGLDLVVVDEAQLTDNPQALRTKAIHEIKSPRRWLLTATPYQNRPENMWALLNWLVPERYPDFLAFKQMYTQSTEGLVLLHSDLSQLMLRRTKKNTLSYFKSPEAMSFGAQLQDGVPRLPKKLRIVPEDGGKYELSSEQSDLIAWMISDYRGWAEFFNANLPEGAERIDLSKINPLQKFGMIQRVIYEPQYFGLSDPIPLFETLDRIVARRLSKGEKVILWAWNTSMIETLERRYRKFGVRRIDGTVVGLSREQARHDFQENQNVRILVANYLSGGVGLTLTAAQAAIFVQLPDRYPLVYQAEGRHQRLIGSNNVRHAKEQVEVEWMIPVFPKTFLETVQNERLGKILNHGTLVEQTRARLEGGETLFNLLMEGYGKVEDLEKYFKAGIIRTMGLGRDEKLNYVSHLRGRARDYAEVIRPLLPLWHLSQGNLQAEEKVLRLIELFKNDPEIAQEVGGVFLKAGKVYFEDLDFFASLFHVGNKYIRAQMLRHLPGLLLKFYAQGKSLTQAVTGLQIGSLTPAAFLALAYVRSEQDGKVIQDMAVRLSEMRNTPLKRYLEEHFYMGVIGILENPTAERVLQEKGNLFAFENAGTERGNGIPERIHALYRLGLLARTRSDLLASLFQGSFDTFHGFSKALAGLIHLAIAEFAQRSPGQVEGMVRSSPLWHGNADPLLALLAGYRDLEGSQSEILVAQFREVLGHLLDGDYSIWRTGTNGRYQGNTIDFLNDSPEFWRGWNQSQVTKLPEVGVEPKSIRMSLLQEYLVLAEEFQQEGDAVEGAWVMGEIKTYLAANSRQKSEIRQRYREELRLLGPVIGGEALTDAAQLVVETYGLKPGEGLAERAAIQQKLEEIRNLLGWMAIDEGFREQGALPLGREGGEIERELNAKVRFYRSRKHDKMAERIAALQATLLHNRGGALTFRGVEIEDTDDPAILTRMGALHPELINCFNPNGNPLFNQFVVAALGSKNMRMVVVREQGKIVAAALAKVKRLENGTPVLFLERGLYRKGYNFRKEMLAHLTSKAEFIKTLIPPPDSLKLGEGGTGPDKVFSVLVMDEVRGKPGEGNPYVFGIGAYTENEYVEPVFGIRKAANVRHRGRIFSMDAKSVNLPRGEDISSLVKTNDNVSVVGIGTSNQSWAEYVSALKAKEVSLVVDIRANPYSRYFPHFNGNFMEAQLAKEEIRYVWMGDTLGNPKDSRGQRTLEGFQAYMKSSGYQSGLARLREVIQSSSGNVALTCAERSDPECHRSLILRDLANLKSSQ